MLRTVPGTELTLTKCLLSLITVIATHYYDSVTSWGSNSEEKTVLVTKGEETAQSLALHKWSLIAGKPKGGPLLDKVGPENDPRGRNVPGEP